MILKVTREFFLISGCLTQIWELARNLFKRCRAEIAQTLKGSNRIVFCLYPIELLFFKA